MIWSNFYKKTISNYYCSHFFIIEMDPQREEGTQVTQALSGRCPNGPSGVPSTVKETPAYPAGTLQCWNDLCGSDFKM